MLDLKYSSYDVVFQEVPNEISLVFNITGCPHHCEGCHSKYMWDYIGRYLKNDIYNIVEEYKNFVTCVCFMGGDQNIKELEKHISKLKNICPNMKFCIYTGLSKIDVFNDIIHKELLDYIKIGPYIEKLGGLDKETTNQRMYRINYNKENILEDITWIFQKKKV